MLRRTWWKAALAGVVALGGLVTTAAPVSAGTCYVVTVPDGSGNPKQIEICPGD